MLLALAKRVGMQWYRLPGEVGESPSLQVSEKHVDVAPKDVVSGHCGGGLGLDWMVLMAFSNCCAVFPMIAFVPFSDIFWLHGFKSCSPNTSPKSTSAVLKCTPCLCFSVLALHFLLPAHCDPPHYAHSSTHLYIILQ